MTNNFNNVSFQNRYLTAEQLNSLSTENLYDYCFIKGNKKDWELDFNKEICDNMDRYPLLSTLAGKPLGYILTKIFSSADFLAARQSFAERMPRERGVVDLLPSIIFTKALIIIRSPPPWEVVHCSVISMCSCLSSW